MACRMRTADAPRGLRAMKFVFRSADGIHFQPVHRLLRQAVPIPGFERPALLQDPVSGKYKLYACGPWQEGAWSIIKFDDANRPDQFVPSTARPVIQPREKSYPREHSSRRVQGSGHSPYRGCLPRLCHWYDAAYRADLPFHQR